MGSSAGRSCVDARETGCGGEGVPITCASKSVSGLLDTPVGVVTRGRSAAIIGLTSPEKELEG
jgi:hypothetical protein